MRECEGPCAESLQETWLGGEGSDRKAEIRRERIIETYGGGSERKRKKWRVG